MKKSAMSAAVIAAIMVTAGCSSAPTGEESPKTDVYVGKTLAYAMDRVDQDHALVYDLTKPVLGKEPTYADDGNDGSFTVIVNCTASNGIGLGVVRTDDLTSTVRAEMAKGGFRSYLAECRK